MNSELSGAAMAAPQSQSSHNYPPLSTDLHQLIEDTLAGFDARTIRDRAEEEHKSTMKGVKCLFYKM